MCSPEKLLIIKCYFFIKSAIYYNLFLDDIILLDDYFNKVRNKKYVSIVYKEILI